MDALSDRPSTVEPPARRLQESEERFRLAMANAPIGMALVGLDGSWIDVNDRLCQILGRSADELLGLTFQDLTHPEDLDADLDLARQLLAGEIQHYEMEKRYLRPSGEVVWALLSGSVVRDADGEPRYFIAQIADITLRKRALLELEATSHELERSNAELQRYAAVAAHDLRSPLATIASALELLSSTHRDRLDEDGRHLLAVATRVTTQMAETVDGLLTLSRVGTDDLDPETVDLAELVTEAVASLGPALQSADADLRLGPLPAVRGDRAQLRLLFQNLLANAVKFRDLDRQLVVTIESVGSTSDARIVVEDNGRGFDAADHERIFEPFARSHGGHNLGAVGLGLATCKRIVERHGGTMTARPTGTGARFEFTLPQPSVPPS